MRAIIRRNAHVAHLYRMIGPVGLHALKGSNFLHKFTVSVQQLVSACHHFECSLAYILRHIVGNEMKQAGMVAVSMCVENCINTVGYPRNFFGCKLFRLAAREIAAHIYYDARLPCSYFGNASTYLVGSSMNRDIKCWMRMYHWLHVVLEQFTQYVGGASFLPLPIPTAICKQSAVLVPMAKLC